MNIATLFLRLTVIGFTSLTVQADDTIVTPGRSEYQQQ